MRGSAQCRRFRMARWNAGLWLLAMACMAHAQAFTVTLPGVDARYLDYQPTHVNLPTGPISGHHRQDLLRFLQSEQGFAMRPLPISTLVLKANGKLEPSGSEYANAIREHGMAAKPGARVTITDVRIENDRIVFGLNGGPGQKHKWLRHVSGGTDPDDTNSVVRDDGQLPSGSRLVLVFPGRLPDIDGLQAEALIRNVVDFNLKTPQEAYADTLPPAIRKSVFEHHVLVGMNTDMVMSALGQPRSKVRERDGNVPFEEWIYGEPPGVTQFVRINGNRVIRVEEARIGEPLVIRTQNEMGDYWSTHPAENIHIVQAGDAPPLKDGEESAPKAPPSLKNPSLKNPGEKLSADKDANTPQMQSEQFPQANSPTPSSTPQQVLPAGVSSDTTKDE